MEQLIDSKVRHLREDISKMAKLTETSFRDSLNSLLTNDRELAEKVRQNDLEIDQMELDLDQKVTEFIITEKPLSRDLRLARVIGMITTDLERIGDIAVRIAGDFINIELNPKPEIADLLTKMGDHALALLSDVIHFNEETTEEDLRAIMKRDGDLNVMFKEFCELVYAEMEKDSSFIRVGSLLLHTGYRLERVGDHAKHIAEDLIYLLTAKDIRHEEKLASAASA